MGVRPLTDPSTGGLKKEVAANLKINMTKSTRESIAQSKNDIRLQKEQIKNKILKYHTELVEDAELIALIIKDDHIPLSHLKDLAESLELERHAALFANKDERN